MTTLILCLQEVAELERQRQQLADDNATLAGHGNHLQKVSYLKRLQLDYNNLKEVRKTCAWEMNSICVRLTV